MFIKGKIIKDSVKIIENINLTIINGSSCAISDDIIQISSHNGIYNYNVSNDLITNMTESYRFIFNSYKKVEQISSIVIN
jgi:hypothetical protein